MQIPLKDLLVDPLYLSATFEESLDMQTYELIKEIYGVNPNNSYEVKEKARGFWEFVGETGVNHFIRINLGTNSRFEVKLGFFDKESPIYDKPNLYFNDSIYQHDGKVLNTYVRAMIENVIPYFFNQKSDGELDIPAIDKARYRLYKMMIDRFLDKIKYEIINDDGSKKFTIKKKA